MEEPIISTTKEGNNEPQLNEDHAHCVFRHPRRSSSRICPPGPDRQHKVLLRSSAAFEGEHSAKATRSVAWEELDSPQQQCTVTEHSSFVNFSPTTTLSLLHLPYSPDLASPNFFLFLKMKKHLKGRCFHTIAKIQHGSQTTTHT
jgi:hypothetical protein